MRSELSVGLIESSAMLCVRVHASDASVGLSSLFGSPTRGSAHLVSKSRITDVSDTFAGLFELPASLCVSGTSVSSLGLSGSPMHGTAPLTGKSGLSNAFAGVLEPSPMLCACMHAWAALKPIRFAWTWPRAPRR